MRRAVLPLGLTCACGLLLACYGRVIGGGEQFAFRDAGAFYYPLYLRVQQEWSAGRWPLWDPWQNGGQPLLGNPMAAVLYPGKLFFGLAPYSWAVRLYVVGHTLVALLGMFALARAAGASPVGAWLGALSYAFGAPVLFQYCNIIYLVGAAWMPWGLLALDRLLREHRQGAALGCAVVMALQVLGGDPEAAYLVAVCGFGYAALLRVRESSRPIRIAWFALLGYAVVWAVVPLALALASRQVPEVGRPTLGVLQILGWGAAALWAFARRRRSGADQRLAIRLAWLAGATVLAASLAAVQLLPSLEFSARSARAGDEVDVHRDQFSVEPYRAVECLWPNVFGTWVPENRSWIQAIPPAGDRSLWEPSLYVSGLTVLLAVVGFGARGADPRRLGLTVLLVVTLLASLGRFGGVLWWVRWLPPGSAHLGPHDPARGRPRTDAFPSDGTASPYAVLAATLPGFDTFRYPAKLLTLTTVALSGLAALGWDRLQAAKTRHATIVSGVLAAASALALALAWLGRNTAAAWLAGRAPPDPTYGPADIPAAWAETERALGHGGLVFAAGFALARIAPRRPLAAGMLALLVMSSDLALANARLIWSVPQSLFDTKPDALRRIEEAESQAHAPGDGPAPLRIHQMAVWLPYDFARRRAPDRLRAQVAWERDTLKPLYALPHGLAYTVTKGTLEVNEYGMLFRSGLLPAPEAVAAELGLAPGDPVRYLPRRSFDLWGTRYFLVPARSDGWTSTTRGFAALLPATDRLAPRATSPDWDERQDWQLLRNNAAFPRAWIVHFARVIPPADGPERAALLRDLTYQADVLWNEPDRAAFNLRAMAFVETADRCSLRGYLSRTPVGPGETVEMVRYDPQTVILRASLGHPGLVILADTDYPGWQLRVDGRPAPIYRANRLMRAAAVGAGTHVLEYRYRPASFAIGAVASALGLAVLIVLGSRLVWKGCAAAQREPGPEPPSRPGNPG